ncbi:MAG TPA: orotidine-5'-phosphate decarboxylase [Ktedonobacteraceae bacterium]|nr:orotidine-5'-phosphate decarboxylase [Ktedonobacteraceae bacterium]
MTLSYEDATDTFVSMLERQWRQGNFVCVGLDSDYHRIPASLKENVPVEDAVFAFNRAIIDATHDLACAYKPNTAFYEAQGDAGWRALQRTVRYVKETYPRILVILDAKRADIGSTNLGYVEAAFDWLGVDAITVHPYLGQEALAPFLARKEKGILVLAKNSNPGAGEFQDLLVGEAREPLYQVVARHVATGWNANGNCALVVGAPYAAELKQVRSIVGDMPILIPGIGTQGGDVEATVKAGKDSRGWGMIINASRSIIFASSSDDFAQAARSATEELRAEIDRYR